jgi:ubiquinone/menaquinone biosynthesis C-methylase UbiE
VEGVRSFYEKNPRTAEYFARLYAENWDGNYGGNTANLYAKVIKVIEESRKLKDKLDIASGPFSLSRAIGKPVKNVDINKHMFAAGRILEKNGIVVPGNIAVPGSMHSLPFGKNSFDLAVNSLALHMLKPAEREQAFREMNRVLRADGMAIITLPYSLVNNTDLTKTYKGLEKLGFEVAPFSGFYKGPQGTSYKGYIAGLRKISSPTAKALPKGTFDWLVDREILRPRSGASKKRKKQFKEQKIPHKEYISEFFDNYTGKTLDDIIRESVRAASSILAPARQSRS